MSDNPYADRALREAVNASCSCGGLGPDDTMTCGACLVWHAMRRAVGDPAPRESAASERAAIVLYLREMGSDDEANEIESGAHLERSK